MNLTNTPFTSRRLQIATIVLLLFVSRAPVAQAEEGQSFVWQADSRAVSDLQIEILRGDIRVRPSSNDRIEVLVAKEGPLSEQKLVTFRVEEKQSQVTIVAEYPPRASRRDPQSRVTLNVEVSLPPGISFNGITEVGDFDGRHLNNRLEATSVVGNIFIDTTLFAEARTTNGNIVAVLGSSDWEGTLDFSTTNGDIEVTVPSSAQTRISATTTNGDFDTDLFPVAKNRFGVPGARVRGVLGSGGPLARVRKRQRGPATQAWCRLTRSPSREPMGIVGR